jgi:hypothetical protein
VSKMQISMSKCQECPRLVLFGPFFPGLHGKVRYVLRVKQNVTYGNMIDVVAMLTATMERACQVSRGGKKMR